jgi:hypothetical protein
MLPFLHFGSTGTERKNNEKPKTQFHELKVEKGIEFDFHGVFKLGNTGIVD